MPNDVLRVTRGSDKSWTFRFQSSAGDPLNLDGYTVALLDTAAAISTKLSATISDEAGGLVTVELSGTDPIAVGRYAFRVQINSATGASIATPEVTINVF